MDPDKFWVHGHTFQPFLDLSCDVKHNRTWTEGKQKGPPVTWPVAWMSMNRQCARLKPSDFARQVPLVDAANSASRHALKRMGLPLLDWAAMSGDEEAACSISTDGEKQFSL